MSLLKDDGRIDFKACLAKARRVREINDGVNRRCPDLDVYWYRRSRESRVRFYMHELRQLVDEESWRVL